MIVDCAGTIFQQESINLDDCPRIRRKCLLSGGYGLIQYRTPTVGGFRGRRRDVPVGRCLSSVKPTTAAAVEDSWYGNSTTATSGAKDGNAGRRQAGPATARYDLWAIKCPPLKSGRLVFGFAVGRGGHSQARKYSRSQNERPTAYAQYAKRLEQISGLQHSNCGQ